AVGIAERLAAKPPKALQKAKELMHGNQTEMFDHIPVEMDEFGKCLQSEEMQMVIARMMSKR
ncbi:MAG: enoyl-CoA hydratase, partial [Pseudomonadota bacterium]